MNEELGTAAERVEKFFADPGYGFCLPFMDKKLSDRYFNKLLDCIRSIGLKQYWLSVTFTCPADRPSQGDLLLILHEKGVEGKNYFLKIFMQIASILGLQFIIYKKDGKNIFRVPTGEDSGFCKYQKITVPDNKTAEEILNGILGCQCEPVKIVAHARSFEGMNGSLLREAIRAKLMAQGEGYLDKMFKKGTPAAKNDKSLKTRPPLAGIWDSCPANSPIMDFFAKDRPVYKLTARTDNCPVIEGAVKLALLQFLMDALGLDYLVGESDEQKSVFLQSRCQLEDGVAIANLLNIVPNEPTDARVETLDPANPPTGKSTPVYCQLGNDSLNTAAKRGYFRVVAKYYPNSFGQYLYTLAERRQQELFKSGELAKINPLAGVLLEEKCACLDLKHAEKPTVAQLAKVISDAGYTIKTVTLGDGRAEPEFMVINQGEDGNQVFIELLLSCMAAVGASRALFRSFCGPLFRIERGGDITFVCNIYEENGLGAIFDKILPHNSSEGIRIRTIAAASGLRLITKRALLSTTMQEYGLNGIAKMLGAEVEPEPFSGVMGRA